MQLLNLSQIALLLIPALPAPIAANTPRISSPHATSMETPGGAQDTKKQKKGKKNEKNEKKADEPKAADGVAGANVDCRIGNPLIHLKDLPEASGIAVGRRTPGILWAHVDAYRGRPAALFALDPSGSVKGQVRVEGIKVDDWEDIAAGPCGPSSCLYLADIGDNQGTRRSITVYRVPEPLATDQATRSAEALQATFPDGPQDAEAFFVFSGGMFLVTKGDRGPAALYRFPMSLKPGSSQPLVKVGVIQEGKLNRGQWITGASASSDGKWLVLRTHNALLFYDAPKFTQGNFGSPLRFDLTGLKEPQGEGVSLGADGSLFLVGEGAGKGAPGTFASAVCRLP